MPIAPEGVLTIGRLDAEVLMVDEVIITRRPPRTAQRVDDATGQALATLEVVADADTTGAGGRSLAGAQGVGIRCWVRSIADRAASDSQHTAEGWEGVRLSLPWDAPEVLAGDVVSVIVTASPRLMGRDLVATGNTARTREVSSRVVCEMRSAQG